MTLHINEHVASNLNVEIPKNLQKSIVVNQMKKFTSLLLIPQWIRRSLASKLILITTLVIFFFNNSDYFSPLPESGTQLSPTAELGYNHSQEPLL